MADRLHLDAVVERHILAMALAGDRATAAKFLRLPADVFALERNKTVAGALSRVLADGPVDVFRVAALASEATGTDEQAEGVQHYVHDLYTSAPPGSSWDYYLEQAVDAMHVRQLLAAGHRLVDLGESASGGARMDEVVKRVREVVDGMGERHGLGVTQPPVSLRELLDQEDEPHDWLVPDLLERMDRLMLTGFEGTGKSYLLAQIALCVAGGLHPFSGMLVNPDGFRVLVLDCENSRPQIRRRYRKTAAIVDRFREEMGLRPVDWSQQLRMNIRPDGIDLGDPRERSRVEDAIASTSPDLVLGGPLYKMHRANLNEEQSARDLVGVLDDLRGRYRFTLILEAHVGYVGETQGGRKLRPTGSSLFLRWPEFGYGIRAFDTAKGEEHPSTVEMVGWRGSRDIRDWPGLLSHSEHELPWSPREPEWRRRHGMRDWTFITPQKENASGW